MFEQDKLNRNMPKTTQPLINQHDDKWSQTMGNAIDRRLIHHRNAIADALELTEDTEIDSVFELSLS
ncbi:MAG: hypothetical protein AB2708_01550 [Candidatus Thiodiazotropha taylori]